MDTVSMIIGSNTSDYEKVSFRCNNDEEINKLIANIYQALIFNNNCITILHKNDMSMIIENNNDTSIKEAVSNKDVYEVSIFNAPKMVILFNEKHVYSYREMKDSSKVFVKISHSGYKPFVFGFDEFDPKNIMNWTDIQEGNDYKAFKFTNHLFVWSYGNPSMLKIIKHDV